MDIGLTVLTSRFQLRSLTSTQVDTVGTMDRAPPFQKSQHLLSTCRRPQFSPTIILSQNLSINS